MCGRVEEGVGKFELSKSVRRTLMSPCPDWNRGSVTARARFRMVSGRGTGRWRGGLAGKVGGKSGGESGEAVSIKYIYTSRSRQV